MILSPDVTFIPNSIFIPCRSWEVQAGIRVKQTRNWCARCPSGCQRHDTNHEQFKGANTACVQSFISAPRFWCWWWWCHHATARRCFIFRALLLSKKFARWEIFVYFILFCLMKSGKSDRTVGTLRGVSEFLVTLRECTDFAVGIAMTITVGIKIFCEYTGWPKISKRDHEYHNF